MPDAGWEEDDVLTGQRTDLEAITGRGRRRMTESSEAQIDRLAAFIMNEVPGEPSQSEGAVDTAIRWMRERLATLAEGDDE